jgi:hypothetical protein
LLEFVIFADNDFQGWLTEWLGSPEDSGQNRFRPSLLVSGFGEQGRRFEPTEQSGGAHEDCEAG